MYRGVNVKIKIKVDNKNKITKVDFNEKHSLDDVVINVSSALCLMLKRLDKEERMAFGLAICKRISEVTGIYEEIGYECCEK